MTILAYLVNHTPSFEKGFFDLDIVDSILETIGKTPVIALTRMTPKGSAELFGKYEAGNPSFSVKDRIALAMIEKGMAEGKITKKTVIVDATAGNTGVALAMVCAVKKLKLLIFMPEDASLERRKMLDGFGADLTVTPKEEGVGGAVARAQAYVREHKESFYLSQFDNPENPEAHRRTTAQEILDDFPDGIDALIAGVGTGGTITGAGEVVKKKWPQVKVVAVEPKTSAVLSGRPKGRHKIQQLGHGFIPSILNRNLIDRVMTVSDEEAYETARRISREEGILVGISSGANVCAALQLAREMGEGKKVLTFLCDAGQRYFSIERFFKSDGEKRREA